MRKVLLATTALVATAGVASAEVSIGGYFYMGYTDISDDASTSASGYFTNSSQNEVYIMFSDSTDSGLNYGWTVDLRDGMDNSTDNGTPAIDESSGYISGDFGKIVFGNNDGADNSFQVGVVGVGDSIAGNNTHITTRATNGTALVGVDSGAVANAAGVGDATGISYFTPNMSGFSMGITHKDGGTAEDDISIGLKYSGEMMGTSFTVGGGRYDNGESGSSERTIDHFGLTLSQGDISIGINQSSDEEGTTINTNNTYYGIGYNVNDQLTVSIASFESENDVTSGDKMSVLGLGASYSLAPGLSLGFGLDQFENTDTSASTKNEGTAMSASVTMSF